MARVRITQIELEDASERVLADALRLITPSRLQELVHGSPAAPVPASIEAPSEPAEELAPARRKRATPAPSAPVVTPAAAPAPGSLGDRILSALGKRAMSSLELANFLKVEPTQVYGPAHVLKQRGLIESFTDEEGDGTRRYRLAGPKE